VVVNAPDEWYEQEIKYYKTVVKDPSDDESEEVSSGEEEVE